MGIIRWLFCHLLAIVFLLSLVFIYSIRDDINNGYINLVGVSSQVQVNNLKTQDDSSVELKKKEEKSLTKDSSKAIAIEAPTTMPDQIANDPWGEVLNRTTISSDAVQPAVGPVAESRFPPENYDPESGVSDKGTIQPKATVEYGRQSAPTASMPAKRSSPLNKQYLTALEEARRLYWQGQAGLAQTAYERLMFEYQDLPEAAEELGNLLLQQGNTNGATWAYKNAVPRYLNLHREQEAISIIRLISQYDPVLAEKLQKKYW